MLIRVATAEDHSAIWSIIGPVIRAGETYTLDRDMGEKDAIAYWCGGDKESFVAVTDGQILGTYYLRPNQHGGGRHVCNCGYMTASAAAGRGIARRMCEHSLNHARQREFRAMQPGALIPTLDPAPSRRLAARPGSHCSGIHRRSDVPRKRPLSIHLRVDVYGDRRFSIHFAILEEPR